MVKVGFTVLIGAACLCSCRQGTSSLPAGVSDALVDGSNCRGYHMSTRPHNRKVVYYAPSGSWFVFHGTGRWDDKLGPEGYAKNMLAWRYSRDGKSFSPLAPAVVGNGHSSSSDVFLAGDHIYVLSLRRNYWNWKAGFLQLTLKEIAQQREREKAKPGAPFFYFPYEVFRFNIAGDHLVAAGKEGKALPGDAHVGGEGPHYGSLTRDTGGYLWVAGRAQAGMDGRYATWVARSKQPDDISEWEPHSALFTSGAAGTHAPQVIGLDEGRVACVLFVRPERMTMVFSYDPTTRVWGKPHVLGQGYESKRASAVFDPGSRRLHVVYTDEAGDARHRSLGAPYAPENWSPPLDQPGILVARQAGIVPRADDDLSLSADLSRQPAPLALVHRGPEMHLHLKYYDGKSWSPKDVNVGLQDPAMSCDEVSAAADFSHGLGFSYYCLWKDGPARKEHDWMGQLRFGLVKNVAALFSGN